MLCGTGDMERGSWSNSGKPAASDVGIHGEALLWRDLCTMVHRLTRGYAWGLSGNDGRRGRVGYGGSSDDSHGKRDASRLGTA